MIIRSNGTYGIIRNNTEKSYLFFIKNLIKPQEKIVLVTFEQK